MFNEQENEINNEFIKNYLRQQMEAYGEPFVEKKAKQDQHQDLECNPISFYFFITEEFGELLGEISKDEELIKTLIELSFFLLDGIQQEKFKSEEEKNTNEEQIHQMNAQIEFERQTAKQFQRMYQDQVEKLKVQIYEIEKLENQISQNTTQITNMVFVGQVDQSRRTVEQKSLNNKFEKIESQHIETIVNLQKQLNESKYNQKALEDDLEQYQQNYSNAINSTEELMKENSRVKLENVRFDAQVKRLENELQKVCLENEQLEHQVVQLQEQLKSQRKFIFEHQIDQSDLIKNQITSFMNSSQQLSQNENSLNTSKIIGNIRVKTLQSEIGTESRQSKINIFIEDNRNNQQKETITEQDEVEVVKDSKPSHSKKATNNDHLQLRQSIFDQTDPSIKNESVIIEQKIVQPMVPNSPSVSKIHDKRFGRLKIRLNITSAQVSNQPSPRAELNFPQETGFKSIRKNLPKNEDDFDDFVDGKQPQKQNYHSQKPSLSIPRLPLNSKPKMIYSSFARENQDFLYQFPIIPLENINTNKETIYEEEKSMIIRGNNMLSYIDYQNGNICSENKQTLIERLAYFRRDPYHEFFELLCQCVKLNSQYLDEIVFIETQDMYSEVIQTGIPYNEWYTWIEQSLLQKAGIDC